MKHRILFLALTLCAVCATAQTKKVQTETISRDILNNDCKETTSFYYDDNDNKTLHGKYTLRCNTQWANGGDSYKFITNEDANYTDGLLNGTYTYNHTLEKKQQATLRYTTPPYYRKATGIDKANNKASGSYKMGKADGKWTISYMTKSLLNNEVTNDKKGNISLQMDNGRLAGVNFSNGEKYTINYYIDTTDEDTLSLVSGRCGKYTIHNGLIVSHFIRLNNDVSPIDDADLSTEIKTYVNPLDHFYPLLEKGFRIAQVKDYLKDDADDFLNTGFLQDYFYALGDKAYKMYQQSNFFSTTYYILHRVKLLSLEEGKKIVDQLIENKYYNRLETITDYHRNPLDYNYTEYFSAATIEQLEPYIDERMSVIRQEEERRIAEEKRKEEERIAEEKRKEEKRIAEEKRKEEERIAEEKRKEEERIAEEKRKEEERKEELKRYAEYEKNIGYINKFYNHYGTKLFANFTKDMQYVPNVGFSANTLYLRSAQTYWNIAYDELKVLDYLRAKSHGYATQEDYDAAEKLTSFYTIFYNYSCEAPMIDSLDLLAKKIKTDSKKCKDVNEIYRQLYSEIKTSKSFNTYSNIQKYSQQISAHIKIQNQCLKFIGVRNEMAKYDEAILDSKAKYIKKLYSAYYEAADKAWSANVSIDKLTPILETQKKVLSIVQRSDIKDFDSKVKKAKTATLEEVLSLSE